MGFKRHANFKMQIEIHVLQILQIIVWFTCNSCNMIPEFISEAARVFRAYYLDFMLFMEIFMPINEQKFS